MVVFGDILRQLALLVTTERVGAAEEEYLRKLGILLPGRLVQECAAVLFRRGIGGQLWPVHIQCSPDLVVGEQCLQTVVIAPGDQLVHFAHVRVDEHAP